MEKFVDPKEQMNSVKAMWLRAASLQRWTLKSKTSGVCVKFLSSYQQEIILVKDSICFVWPFRN